MNIVLVDLKHNIVRHEQFTGKKFLLGRRYYNERALRGGGGACEWCIDVCILMLLCGHVVETIQRAITSHATAITESHQIVKRKMQVVIEACRPLAQKDVHGNRRASEIARTLTESISSLAQLGCGWAG